MKRKQIEEWMKLRGMRQIDLIFKKDDKLAIYCMFSGGYLKKYDGTTIDRNMDIYGYLAWKDNSPIQVPFEKEELERE